MYFDESDIRQVTETVWELMLRLPLSAGPRIPHPSHVMAARVEIRGPWNGNVAIMCDDPLARELAGAMYQCTGTELPEADVKDALGELANVLGGNMRALLPEGSLLSLPKVALGVSPAAGKTLYELDFTCAGKPFWVVLQEIA